MYSLAPLRRFSAWTTRGFQLGMTFMPALEVEITLAMSRGKKGKGGVLGGFIATTLSLNLSITCWKRPDNRKPVTDGREWQSQSIEIRTRRLT